MHLLYGISGKVALIPLWGTLIGLGIDLLIVDFVIVLLGRNKRLRNWFAIRGYYFDYNFQDEWNDKVTDL
jgi:hypothetical protein